MPYSDQSVRPPVRPSILPSVRLRSLLRNISSLALAQYGSYFTHRVLSGKEYEVALKHVSMSKVKVIAELYFF